MARLIAIGDIHGCSLALASVLRAIRPSQEDSLVVLGDYIDCGLDSSGVIDQLIDLEKHCRLVPLLGNHEEMILSARHSRKALEFWLNCGGLATQHKVTLTKGFLIGIHPVVQACWQIIMGNNPSHFKGDDLPVEQVSWEDCQDFLRKLGERDGHAYRLPTKAEWEYACRAGTMTPFFFGEEITAKQANSSTDAQRKALHVKPVKLPKLFTPTVRKVREIVPNKLVAKIKPASAATRPASSSRWRGPPA